MNSFFAKGIRFFTVLKLIFSRQYKEYLSFAQAGEDRVIKLLFRSMGISRISYLEIGTNNPVDINNTYIFYLDGSRGVCIEPNPTLIAAIKAKRPGDVCLNTGISGAGESELDFYTFDDADSEKGCSTFSKSVAEQIERSSNIKIAAVQKIGVTSIVSVLEEYFPGAPPDLISIDVEGLDLEILQSIDFQACRPKVFCVETVEFSQDHRRKKNTAIIDFMNSQNYLLYADTGINSIFADGYLFDQLAGIKL